MMTAPRGPNRAATACATVVVLTAAIAVVLEVDRQFLESPTVAALPGHPERWPVSLRWLAAPSQRAASALGAGLVVLTLGLGLATIRGPFVPPGHRWPGRGRAAIVAATLGIAYGAAWVASEALADPGSTSIGWANPHLLADSLRNCAGRAQGPVLGAWALLAIAGRWRSREDWPGRLGRLVGWGWLGLAAYGLVSLTI